MLSLITTGFGSVIGVAPSLLGLVRAVVLPAGDHRALAPGHFLDADRIAPLEAFLTARIVVIPDQRSVGRGLRLALRQMHLVAVDRVAAARAIHGRDRRARRALGTWTLHV